MISGVISTNTAPTPDIFPKGFSFITIPRENLVPRKGKTIVATASRDFPSRWNRMYKCTRIIGRAYRFDILGFPSL